MGTVMLTTIDNPFNPHHDWDNWKRFDEDKGYNTCGYLARIAMTSPDLSDTDNDLEVERAIDEIVKLNINGMYKKIYENENMNDRGEGD